MVVHVLEPGTGCIVSYIMTSSPRTVCPICERSRALYCEDCLLVLEQPAPQPIRLPCKKAFFASTMVLPDTEYKTLRPNLQIDIVQHAETNTRSTALHAALLAPGDVTVWRHEGGTKLSRQNPLDLQLPEFDAATTVVLFPGGQETGVVGQCAPFERVVLLESNWKKAPGLLRHPRLAPLRRVQLPAGLGSGYSWRRGDCSFRGAVEEGLSSIEAIYHCCRLLGGQGVDYEGLLRYFKRTQRLVEGRQLPTSRQEARARQRRHTTLPAGAGSQQPGTSQDECASAAAAFVPSMEAASCAAEAPG